MSVLGSGMLLSAAADTSFKIISEIDGYSTRNNTNGDRKEY